LQNKGEGKRIEIPSSAMNHDKEPGHFSHTTGDETASTLQYRIDNTI